MRTLELFAKAAARMEITARKYSEKAQQRPWDPGSRVYVVYYRRENEFLSLGYLRCSCYSFETIAAAFSGYLCL